DSIVWDFGDATTFTGLTSPTHVYAAPGRYGVSMTVYNDLLCTGSYIDSVDVYPLPLANFTTSLSCSTSPTIFDANASSVIGDTITSWLWNFDGLGTATTDIAQFSFQDSGSYDITLIVTTIHGCSDTIQSAVSVIQSPDFDFVYNEPCFGDASVFTYTSLTLPPPPANLQWDFGDGTLSFLLSPSHIYTTVDTFAVILTVQNPNTLCTTTKSKNLIVKPLPDVGFIANDNCEDLPLQLTDTSTVQSGTVVAWNWNLGTLGTSTVSNPIITPDQAGTYPVTLQVTTDKGCTSSTNKTITIFSKPDAFFTPDPTYGSPPLTVNIVNSTTGALSYSWDFGDGSTGSGSNPQHMYSDTGIYNIVLIAASAEGCLDTATSIVSVLIPNIDIGVRKIFATRDGDKINLTAELINAGNVLISEFTIKGIIENGSAISEHWNGSFAPGTIILYKFQSSYEVDDAFSPSYYCIEALYPNDTQDMNTLNNKKCEVLTSEFELFASYPNPFNEIVNVNFNLNTAGQFSVEIINELGQVVIRKENLSGLKGFNTVTLDTYSLSKGTYTCVVRFREDKRAMKIMKLK
ncbi:MAG TPA: PKD domain-containing protein, partial [Bacteroidia bacterium]|nr:PKD domain-containing protein [Bacteroidia bacterium]